MSCNVWLSFFRSYDAAALRRLEYKYLLACYGVPFVPALIYLFVSTMGRGKIYGSAVVSQSCHLGRRCAPSLTLLQLWCWVSMDWDFLRVATFYGPVWFMILLTIAVYVRVGLVIFKWRKQLLSMERTEESNEFPATGIIKTSEVTITTNEELGTSRPESATISKKPSFPGHSGTIRRTTHTRVHRPSGGIDPNKAAVKYCKCALLFFIALLITWVPSTINRIYTLFRPTDVLFGLNLAAAVVLPLQGFWNAIIYMTTSSFAVKCLWSDIRDACRSPSPSPTSVQMRGQLATSRQAEFDESASKVSSNTLRYDPDRSSSQSELVGQGK